jgi:hypothetical protein
MPVFHVVNEIAVAREQRDEVVSHRIALADYQKPRAVLPEDVG